MCNACSKFPIKTSTSLNLIISLSDGKDAVSSILYSDIFQVFYTFFSHYYYHTTMVRWQFILTFVFNTGANKISFTLLSITHSARARKLKYTPTNSTIIEIKTQLVKIAGLSKTPFLQNTPLGDCFGPMKFNVSFLPLATNYLGRILAHWLGETIWVFVMLWART